MHSLIPMISSISLQCRKDNGQYDLAILFDQVLNVIVVPQEESSLCHLRKEESTALCEINVSRTGMERRYALIKAT